MADDVKRLEARIAELENKLAGIIEPSRGEAAEITPEEFKAYQKVRDVVAADWGDFCGINDCFRRCIKPGGFCVRCVCLTRCINECVCGPCAGGGSGGGGQFGGFGG